MTNDAPVQNDLTPDEVRVLCHGLAEWGGPARCSDGLAAIIGFTSAADFAAHADRIVAVLQRGEALTAVDWRRTLLATEIVFASDIVGSGVEWSTTTGLSDEETIRLLRGIQRKFARAR
jgi:hypothetical protein